METKPHILVVDDETELCANIKDILESNDYFVECAANGKEAIELTRKDVYDIALVDIKLPDTSGTEIVSEILKISPSTEFIYMTGHAMLDSAIEAVKQKNVVSYETKPLNMDHLLSIIKQITERKRVEKEREHLISALNNKNREMEQIVYITSHDLRSPMVNIQGFSKELEKAFEKVHSVLNSKEIPSVIKHKLAPVLEEDIPEALRYIFTSTYKMDSVISGMSKVSRAGSAAITIKQLGMHKLISYVVDTFGHTIKKMGVTVHLEELPQCRGDERQINQVFSNLLGNALNYLDPGRKGIIKISGRKVSGQVEYCVEDNGIGIPADCQDKIFEIFQRLNPDDSNGEGLGLTIVHKILDRHDGKIWVESKPGKGTKFFVALPG